MGVRETKKKAWKVFSTYIRTRDCIRTTGTKERGRCISCGEVFDFRWLQAGHLIGGRNNSILFDERGVHAQCHACNMYKQGNTIPYLRAMKEMYGQDVIDELESLSKETRKFTVPELEELIKKWKEETKKLLKDL